MKILSIEKMKPAGGEAARFQGFEHGAKTSFFVAETVPGGGPALHRHPYEETFVVLKGEIEFTAGDETQKVNGRSIVVVPANTWHRFANLDDAPALLVNIHPAAKMITEWVPGAASRGPGRRKSGAESSRI